MSTLAKPTLGKPELSIAEKGSQALAFAEGSKPKAAAKVFHAPAGYRRLTINLQEDIHKKIRLKAIEQDCTVTDIITKLLEQEVK